MPGNKFDVTQRPDKQKLYSTAEIAEMLDCTTSVIRNITSYYHITAEKEHREKSVRMSLYSYESFKLIKEYREARRNKEKRRMIKESPAMTEEEIAALEDHSLVIDKRCLDFNYWPDTVPACFQECEECTH